MELLVAKVAMHGLLSRLMFERMNAACFLLQEEEKQAFIASGKHVP